MRRRRAFLIIFICWGTIVALGSIYLILAKQKSLIAFSKKVAEEEIIYFPLRAPIVDCNGRNVCFTEWIFFVSVPLKQQHRIKKLSDELQICCTGQIDSIKCIIPKEKLSAAVKLCRKYRLRIRKHIIRRTIDLPTAVKQKLGTVAIYSGLTGIEAEYNKYLQGSPGIYRAIRSPHPVRNVENDSLRIMSPMLPGRTVRLKQSVIELQCGILPEVSEVK